MTDKDRRFSQFIRKAQREGATSENVKLLEDFMDDDIKALRDELGISKRAFLRHLILMSMCDPVTAAYVAANDEPACPEA